MMFTAFITLFLTACSIGGSSTGTTLAFTSSSTPAAAAVHQRRTSTSSVSSQTTFTVLFSSSSDATTSTTSSSTTVRAARDLVQNLVVDQQCYSSEEGARAFGDKCHVNVVYEDCFEPQPVVGKTPVTQHMLSKVQARQQNRGTLRVDMMSDGNRACGFAWTYVVTDEEGLRGTTYVELNEQKEIIYIREIPEPIFKPNDLTVKLLKAVTEGAEPKAPKDYQQRMPNTASDMVDYLFNEVQGSSVDESMRCFDEKIVYRDFNYDDVLRGKSQVREFIEKFQFPGIEFRAQRIDDGIDSCCFTWEVALDGAEDTIKGISFYKLDPDSRKVVYVRDIPESAVKPAPLGKLARQLRPGLGVFQGVKVGSRPGGL